MSAKMLHNMNKIVPSLPLLLLSALIFTAGCPGKDGECTPINCEDANKDCGRISDGCGDTVTCGECGSGETCGGSDVPNVCGPGTCTPRTCEGLGRNCGMVSDGCADVLSCGTCPSGQTCGGGGAPGVCGSGECTPITCEEQGANCGTIPDGCEGYLACGGCEDDLICGGIEDNVCGLACPDGCPSGWECNRVGTCVGGDRTALDIDVPTVTIRGHVTLNGADPSRSCPWPDAVLGYVRFVETTRGYSFDHTIRCDDHPSRMVYDLLVFPGTYKVMARGESENTNLPATYFVVHPELTIASNRDGLILDVPTVSVKGYVTLDGENPSRTCPWPDAVLGYVRFVEKTQGYSFDHTIRCQDHASRLVYDLLLFPGTYEVMARGEAENTNLPPAYFVVHSELEVASNRDGLILDVPTVRVTGYVTLNGADPTRDCYYPDSVLGYVRFRESNHGYLFDHAVRCSDHQTRFTYDLLIFPGTYAVSARGESENTNLPAAFYVAHPELAIASNRDGLVLDVPTVTVRGYVTLNGSDPSRVCHYNDSVLGQVRFRESTHGYLFDHTIRCADHSTRFAYELLIFPGSYEVSARGDSENTNLPPAYYVVHSELEVGSNRDGLVLDVPTVTVRGYVTLNGTDPSRECSYNDSVLGYVRFREARHGYLFDHTIRCADHSTRFAYDLLIFPGTYEVLARGDSESTDLPSPYYVAHPEIAIATNRDGLVLDVQTVQVSGRVTLNGAVPSRNCPWPDAVLGSVRLREVTRGYLFDHTIRCDDHTSRFVFDLGIFPGTYRVSARGDSENTDLPSTHYVAWPRIELR